MKGSKLFIHSFLVMILLVSSCGKQELTVSEFYTWHEDEGNGYHHVKRVGDLEFDIKYLPAEYLAYQELQEEGQWTEQQMDSIMQFYENNLAFLLTIGPADDAKEMFDITKVGVLNYEEFDERARNLNFGMKEHLTLAANGREWKAVLCEMENVYGLSYHRTFNIVFSPAEDLNELKELKKFKFTIDDEIFNSGKNSFAFNMENLVPVPKIKA